MIGVPPVTVIVIFVVLLSISYLEAVIVYWVLDTTPVGVPLITPVVGFMLNPDGNGGVTVHVTGVSPTAPRIGVNDTAFPVIKEYED